jgi:hypothetical protein
MKEGVLERLSNLLACKPGYVWPLNKSSRIKP